MLDAIDALTAGLFDDRPAVLPEIEGSLREGAAVGEVRKLLRMQSVTAYFVSLTLDARPPQRFGVLR